VDVVSIIKDVAVTVAAVLGAIKTWLEIKEHHQKKKRPKRR